MSCFFFFFFSLGRSSVHCSYVKATSPGSKLGPRWWQDVGLALSSPLLSFSHSHFLNPPFVFCSFSISAFVLFSLFCVTSLACDSKSFTPKYCRNHTVFSVKVNGMNGISASYSDNNNSRSQRHCIDTVWTESWIGIYCRSAKAFQVCTSANKNTEKYGEHVLLYLTDYLCLLFSLYRARLDEVAKNS